MSEEFAYHYSAKEQKELEAIRAKYQPKTESKMDQLRRLDASASRPGTIVALVLGIVGMLVLGSGMSLIFLCEDDWFFVGLVLGLVGMFGVCIAYPVYQKITQKQRARLAPEILRLTDEIEREQR